MKTGSSGNQFEAFSLFGGTDPRGGAKFSIDVQHMGFDSGKGDAKVFRNLRICFSFCKLRKDFQFPGTENALFAGLPGGRTDAHGIAHKQAFLFAELVCHGSAEIFPERFQNVAVDIKRLEDAVFPRIVNGLAEQIIPMAPVGG